MSSLVTIYYTYIYRLDNYNILVVIVVGAVDMWITLISVDIAEKLRKNKCG
jgi:hypothetical protein